MSRLQAALAAIGLAGARPHDEADTQRVCICPSCALSWWQCGCHGVLLLAPMHTLERGNWVLGREAVRA